MSYCFVCLEKASRKVCPKCKCYAHNKCWGEYLKNSTKTHTALLNSDTVVVFSPWSAKCPQCRGSIMNTKPITRSDTHMGRSIAMVIDYTSYLTELEKVKSLEESLPYAY